MASPTGADWNQILGWLKIFEVLRKAMGLAA
jgi:hypothetical protein